MMSFCRTRVMVSGETLLSLRKKPSGEPHSLRIMASVATMASGLWLYHLCQHPNRRKHK